MWSMVVKEFRQLRRDHRTLALLVMLPVVLLVVFGYAARFDVVDAPTLVVGPQAQAAAGRLPEILSVVDVRSGDGRAEAEDALRRGEAGVALVTGGGGTGMSTGAEPVALVDGSQLFLAQAAVGALRSAPGAPPVEVLFNPGLSTATVMVPALIGLVLVFVGTMATSLGVVRERQEGTLEQLAVMPLRPRDVFAGKLAPYLLVAIVDLTVIVTAGMVLFDVPFEGSVPLFAAGAALFLFVTLGIGVLISTVSANQGQAIQLAVLAMVPQVLLSGMIFPVDSMGEGVRWIASILPLTYFVEIARGVMLRDAPAGALTEPLALLAVLGLAVSLLAVWRFRTDLLPTGRSGGAA